MNNLSEQNRQRRTHGKKYYPTNARNILGQTARILLAVIVGAVMFTLPASCVDEEEFSNSPQGNFEALWKIIDEHYCFFDYKKEEYGLDWDGVYNKYKVRVNDRMTNEQLFEVMADMLGELRDGHVKPGQFGRLLAILEMAGGLSGQCQRHAITPISGH